MSHPTVSVRLFARARELAGSDSVDLQLPTGATVATLKAALIDRCPQLRPLAPALLVAVNQEYVSGDLVIPPGSQIACFPPVSGG